MTGCDSDDDQKHLFYCPVLLENTVLSDNIEYDDIFQQTNVFKQEQVVNIMFKHFQKRNSYVYPNP